MPTKNILLVTSFWLLSIFISSCGSSSDEPSSNSPIIDDETGVSSNLNDEVTVTPLSDGRIMVEASNEIATARWTGRPQDTDYLIDEVESVTVSVDGRPNISFGVTNSAFSSLHQDGGWSVTFENIAEDNYQARITNPGAPDEIVDIGAVQIGRLAVANNNKGRVATNRDTSGQQSFFVNPVCAGKTADTKNTVVSLSIYDENSGQEIHSDKIVGRNPTSSSNSIYEFSLPENIESIQQGQFLNNISAYCESFIAPFLGLSSVLIDAFCLLNADQKVRLVCDSLDLESVNGLTIQQMLTKPVSEGGLVRTCSDFTPVYGVLSLLLPGNSLPLSVSARVYDPRLGKSDLIRSSYDSYDVFVNTFLDVPYNDTVKCDIEESGEFIVTSRLNTQIQVEIGDSLKIEASGQINLGFLAGSSTPEGIEYGTTYNYYNNARHGQLLGLVNDNAFFIGQGGNFVSQWSGFLELLVNDNDPFNNVGGYRVKVIKNGS